MRLDIGWAPATGCGGLDADRGAGQRAGRLGDGRAMAGPSDDFTSQFSHGPGGRLGSDVAERSIVGDAPRWVTLHALGVVLGSIAALLLRSSRSRSCAAQVSLAAAYRRRRPLTRVERTYARTAAVVIAGWAFLSARWAGVACALVAVGFFLDRAVAEPELS